MLKSLVATFQTVMGSSLSQQSALDIITHWRLKPAHELLFDSNLRDQEIYMQAVDKLQQSPNIKGFNELILIAMARLKREFQEVLSRQTDYQAAPPASTTGWSTYTDSTANVIRYEDYNTVCEMPNREVILYLRSIAERMNTSGKLGECVSLYKSVRKNFLQAQLKRLRFEELYIGENSRRFLWDELKVKIEHWNQVSKICVKILFEREKQLCDQIFQGLGTNVECFVGTVDEFAVTLFAFAEAVSTSNQSYDRMEAILGLYDSFDSVLSNVNVLFPSEPGEKIIDCCLETLSKIQTEVVRMLYDFQKSILYEIPNSLDERGSIHQSTKYAMEKIDQIVRNKRLLTNLIKSAPSLKFDGLVIPQEELGDTQNRSFLDLHLILIIAVLQRNIESKSEFYKDPSLKYLFIMNNVRYIVQKIEGPSDLQEMISYSYLKKLNENVELARNGYQESTCSKFLNCFKNEGLYVTQCFKHQLSKTTLKKRIKAFNAVFEETQRIQTSWMVPDLKLKEEICVSMSNKLVPEYKNFLSRFGSDSKFKALEKNIKYTVENLEALIIEELFAYTDN